jgi:hypothetical protein
MKIEKNLKISQVIINERNIEDLITKISEEYESDSQIIKNKDESSLLKISFLFITDDDIIYESENPQEFFSNGRYLINKRVKVIKINYSNYNLDGAVKRIDINISNRTYSENTILISGKDELWVNGVYKYFEDYIESWEKQESWFIKFNILLRIIFALFFGTAYFFILRIIGIYIFFGNIQKLYIKWSDMATSDKTVVLFLTIGLSLFLGIVTGYFILKKIAELYPNIELKLGPEYLHRENLKRNKLYKIITIIIIPLIIGVIMIIIGILFK